MQQACSMRAGAQRQAARWVPLTRPNAMYSMRIMRPMRGSGIQACKAAKIDTAPTLEEALAGPKVRHYYRDMAAWPTPQDTPLATLDPASNPEVDLVIAGAGPSGLAVGARVAEAGYSVAIIDPAPHGVWPNNYGVWVDEFQAMGLEDCLEVIWPKAKVFLDNSSDPGYNSSSSSGGGSANSSSSGGGGGSHLGAKYLDRPYGRVDRPRLKRKLLERCAAAGVRFVSGKAGAATHANGRSSIAVDGGANGAGGRVTGTLALDATGHARKLVEFDQKFDPGYQGAYGIIAEVESHPFDIDTMLFMDWRDDHLDPYPDLKAGNAKLPTFLYAMPFSENRIFLEETSLVARPAVGFEDLKKRLDARLKWLGIKVTAVEEEEYCLIPMGGCLPVHPQRVLGVGGTAGMVHPATGFMMSRMLGAAPGVADAIIEQLARPRDALGPLASASASVSAAGASQQQQVAVTEAQANAMSAAVWRAAWPVGRLRQRAFFCFGMDVLLRLNLAETREFFAAFFSLSAFHWHGFLSARLGFLQLIAFGLSLFAKSSNRARADLLAKGLPGLVVMLAGLVPTLGRYYEPEPEGLFAASGSGSSGSSGSSGGSSGNGGSSSSDGNGNGGGGGSAVAAATATAPAAVQPVPAAAAAAGAAK